MDQNRCLTIILILYLALSIECVTKVTQLYIPGDFRNHYYAKPFNYCQNKYYTVLIEDEYDLANMTLVSNIENISVSWSPNIMNDTQLIATIQFQNISVGEGYLNFTVINSNLESTVIDNLLEYSCENVPYPLELELVNGFNSVMSRDDLYFTTILFYIKNWNPNYIQSFESYGDSTCGPQLICSPYNTAIRPFPTQYMTVVIQLLPPYIYDSNNFTFSLKNPSGEFSNISFIMPQIIQENPDANFVDFHCSPNSTSGVITFDTYFCFISAINSSSLIFMTSEYDPMNTIKIKNIYGTPENKTMTSFHLYRGATSDSHYFISIQPGNTTKLLTNGTATYNPFAFKYPQLNYSPIQSYPLIDFTNENGSDIIAPSLNSIEFIPFGIRTCIIKINVTDEFTGFSSLAPYLITSGDIVSGTIQDGVFEILFNYSTSLDMINDIKMLISDYLNSKTIDSFYYANTGGKISTDPTFENILLNPVLGLENFTQFYFSPNDIDTTNGPVWTTLFFNLTNPNPNTQVVLIPLYQYSDALQALTIVRFGGWDEKIQLYTVKILVKGRTFNGKGLTFLLVVGSGTFFGTEFVAMFPENGTLRVNSDFADEFPPIISHWEAYPSSIVEIDNIDDEVTIAFNLTIEDLYNGFDYGYLNIRGLADPGVYYNFTSENITQGDDISGVYTFTLKLNGACKSDNYSITEIRLVDKGGWESFSGQMFIHPFLRFLDNEYPIIQVKCPASEILNDTTPPSIIEFSTFPTSIIDVGGIDRSLTINITVNDYESGVNINRPPLINIYNVKGVQYTTNLTKFIEYDSLTNNTVFQLKINELPYGFGYPYGLYFTVERLFDNSLNFISLSTKQLSSLNFISNLTTQFSATPIIISHNPISSMDTILTIYGKSLSSGLATSSKPMIKYQGKQYQQTSIHTKHNVALILKVKPSISPYYIQIQNNNGEINSNEYLITPIPLPVDPTISPSDSSNEIPNLCDENKSCSGNGICTNTGCVCISPWVGKYCNSRIIVIPVEPSPNVTDPSFQNSVNGTLPNGDVINFATLVSVVSVREFDISSNMIFEYKFNQWLYTNISEEGSTQFLYSANITKDNINTSISITVQWFKDETNISFANQNLIMNPSTMKYKIDIEPFNFESKLNSLQVVMLASILTSSQSDICSLKEFGKTSDINYEYVKLQIADHSLYGKFLNVGVLDGRVVQVSNELLQSDETTDSSIQTESFIGITIPNFKKYAILDPDFSILLDTSPADEEQDNSVCQASNSKNSLSKTQLAGIIIGIIGFVLVVILVTVYIIYKRKQDMVLKKTFESRSSRG